MHDFLPEDLVAKVFSYLSTKHRARASSVCKEWHNISTRHCTEISLEFASLEELQARRAWLDMLAKRAPTALQQLQMHWKGGRLLHPAPGSLHLESFINLRRLDLKRPNNNCWLTTPKTMQGLASLSNLETLIVSFSPSTIHTDWLRLSRVPDSTINLDLFANFPKLNSLAVTLHPCRGWESGWHLDLSHRFEGLRKLEDLTLEGLKKIIVSPAFEAVVSKLTSLDLRVHVPIQKAVSAPKLVSLKFWTLEDSVFPFKLTACFQSLKLNTSIFPFELHTTCPHISELDFGDMVDGVSRSEAQALQHFQGLRKLKIIGFAEDCDLVDLALFANFERLESLELAMTGARDGCQHFTQELTKLKNLTSLKIYSLVQCALHYGGGIEHLKGLRIFQCEAQSIGVSIESSSLEELHLYSTQSIMIRDCCIIGALPELKELHLHIPMELQGSLKLLRKLRELPRLRHLSLEKRCLGAIEQMTPDGGVVDIGIDNSAEAPGFTELLLHHVRQLAGLKIFQLAAVNNDISLDRVILPKVEHLSIACRGLAVSSSCMPWSASSVQLLFLKANNYTHQLLQASHDITLTECHSEITPYFSATKTALDELPYAYGDDVWVECCQSDPEDGLQYFPCLRMD